MQYLVRQATRSISLIAALLAAWLIWRPEDSSDPGRLYSMASTLASVAGVLLGFIIAAFAVLVSASDRTLIRNMRKTGHLVVLRRAMLSSASMLALTVALSLALLALPWSWAQFIAPPMAASGVLSIILTWLAGRKFMVVVNTLMRSDR